jgi:hypothetical protein
MSASQFVYALPHVLSHLLRGVEKEEESETSRELNEALSIALIAAERWRIEADGLVDDVTDASDDDDLAFE